MSGLVGFVLGVLATVIGGLLLSFVKSRLESRALRSRMRVRSRVLDVHDEPPFVESGRVKVHCELVVVCDGNRPNTLTSVVAEVLTDGCWVQAGGQGPYLHVSMPIPAFQEKHLRVRFYVLRKGCPSGVLAFRIVCRFPDSESVSTDTIELSVHKLETAEEREARRVWEMANSEDPDIWEPLG